MSEKPIFTFDTIDRIHADLKAANKDQSFENLRKITDLEIWISDLLQAEDLSEMIQRESEIDSGYLDKLKNKIEEIEKALLTGFIPKGTTWHNDLVHKLSILQILQTGSPNSGNEKPNFNETPEIEQPFNINQRVEPLDNITLHNR